MVCEDVGFTCKVCDYKTATKQRILYHVEAKHSESPGYYCEICEKHCPTKNAFNIHNTRYHRS